MRPAAGDTSTAQSDEKQMMMVVPAHGLAWTRGAGALRTGWKRIGVGVCASGDVRGGAPVQAEGRLAL